MSGPDVHTLTGAYALDALGESERRQFDQHLHTCPDCTREVEELRATSARLGLAVAARPPESLRRRVMAQVQVTRQDSPTGRARRGGWSARLIATAAAVATAASIGFAVDAVRTGHERDAARAELARVQARYAPVARLASAPDARGGSATGTRGGSAFVLASRTLDEAVLLVSDLPAVRPGRTYQAWIIGNGRPRSVGLVGAGTPDDGPAPLRFGDLGGAVKVALTIEPFGGSAQPTTTPVLLFDLPS